MSVERDFINDMRDRDNPRLYYFNIDGKLEEIALRLDPEEQEALYNHFVYGTPASTLAKILTEEGYPISETTIKAQRRKNKIGA